MAPSIKLIMRMQNVYFILIKSQSSQGEPKDMAGLRDAAVRTPGLSNTLENTC